MSDKLNLSLDQIIKKNETNISRERKTIPVKSSVPRRNVAKHSRSAPLKEIVVERPKIVKPGQSFTSGAPATNKSVFSRLGSSGGFVVFKNLAASVKQQDVLELSKAVGEVKKINFLQGLDGMGQARIQFSEKKIAEACVQKYNGIALDNVEMHVALDNNTQSVGPLKSTPRSGAGLIATGTGKTTNIRAGLFGTALEETTRTVSFSHQRRQKKR